MANVILHGRFAVDQDGPIKIQGKNVFEIVEGLSHQVSSMRPNPHTGKARVKIVGYETQESLYQDIDPEETIHIIPQFNGGKSGNAWLQIAAGIALIAVSFVPGIGALAASIAMKVGTMLVLGGLSQLLAPQPESDKDDQIKNRYLGAPGNTVQIGTRIPILYGEDRVYGHFLSFDINAQQFNGAAAPSNEGK